MSEFNVKAIFSADIAKFKAGVAAVIGESERLNNFNKMNAKGVGETFKGVGRGMTMGLTVPIAGLMGATSKMSMNFESAMAGVRKTTDLTDREFAILTDDIRQMSKVLPASAVEIAGVAEAAGQLGIEKENLSSFSKTMIDLGESTNLTADQAAIDLARLANITQMPQTQFDRLGSTIVDLGNNFATSEAEIVSMGLRLAGTGKQVGMTEHQIMAMATAMTSVGINAEAGGSSMSRVMQKMNTAVISGSDKVEGFAKVAGMSASEFATAWKERPQEALTEFIKGIGKANASGEDTITMLKELGINGIREVDVMQRLSGAGELLGNALDVASNAWDKNTALTHEAELRYQTMEAQMAMAKNTLVDAGRAIGDVVAPMFVEFAKGVARVADAFTNLSPGTQTAIVGFLGLLAALGPVIWILGSLISNVQIIGAGFIGLKGSATALATKLGLTKAAAGGVGAALGKIAAAASPILIVVGVIGLVVAALKTAWTNSETFRDTVTSAVNDVKASFEEFKAKAQAAFDQVAAAVAPVVAELRDLWNRVVGALTPALGALATLTGGFLAGAFSLFSGIIQGVAHIISFFAPLVTGLLSILGGLASLIGGVLAPVFNVLGSVFYVVMGNIKFLIDKFFELVNAIMGFVQPAIDFLGGALEKVGGFFKGVGDFVGGFAEKVGLGMGKVQEVTQETAEVVGATTEDVKQTATSNAQQMETEVVASMQNMGNQSTSAMQSMSSNIISELAPMLAEMPVGFQMMANETVSIMQAMGINSIEEANNLVSGVGLKWEEMSTWTEKDWAAVKAIVDNSMSDASSTAQKQSDDILSKVGTNWDALSDSTDFNFEDIESIIASSTDASNVSAVSNAQEINSEVSSEFADLQSSTNSTMSDISSTITNEMQSASSSAKNVVSSMSADFKSAFSNISQMIQSSMKGIASNMQSSMKSIESQSKSALNSILNTFKNSYKQIQQQVTSSMNQMLAIKRTTLQAFVSTTQTGMNRVVSAFQSGTSNAVSVVNGYKGFMHGAGFNLSMGMANGIWAGQSAVINAAASVAAAAVRAAQARLAIHSPSRVAEKEIGAYFPAGIARGITRNEDSVVSATEGMIDNMMKVAKAPEFDFSSRLGELSAKANSEVDYTIKDNMQNKQPLELILAIGKRHFKAFVDDISQEQGKEIELVEVYGF